MAKYEIKTKKSDASVDDFINSVKDDQQRRDAKALVKIMRQATGQPPVMWGSSIIGFGTYHYKGKSSEGDWMATGFSPRKQSLTIYVMPGFDRYDRYLKDLGKHTTSVGCLYVKRLADIDTAVLEKLVKDSYQFVKAELDQA